MSGQHASKVERSRDLQRLVEMLKEAPHPLSSQEIAQEAYPEPDRRTGKKKYMLNVSEKVGEIRNKEKNPDYEISGACRWKSDRYPWHDAQPRYYLIAAPGWAPKWTIDSQGDLVYGWPYGTPKPEDRPSPQPSHQQGEDEPRCMNPDCNKPIQRTPEDPLKKTCNAECRKAWIDSVFGKDKNKDTEKNEQGALL